MAYSGIDSVNRAVTLGVADQMISDLMRNSKLAQAALTKFPTVIQSEIQKSLVAGNEQAAHRVLAEYLNAATQFNYNRASLSEFGRTMGPLFSTFTKWPSAIAGDIVQEYRDRGIMGGSIRNAEKYIAPLLLLQVFDSAILGEGSDSELSDRKKLLFGKYGLSSAAPIGTIKSIATGDFFTPPVVDAVYKGVISPVIIGRPEQVHKNVVKAVDGFMPGSVWVRVFTKDLPTLMEGKKPSDK
jgi:hypothetical protein